MTAVSVAETNVVHAESPHALLVSAEGGEELTSIAVGFIKIVGAPEVVGLAVGWRVAADGLTVGSDVVG